MLCAFSDSIEQKKHLCERVGKTGTIDLQRVPLAAARRLLRRVRGRKGAHQLAPAEATHPA